MGISEVFIHKFGTESGTHVKFLLFKSRNLILCYKK